jgi:hypothetical protein
MFAKSLKNGTLDKLIRHAINQASAMKDITMTKDRPNPRRIRKNVSTDEIAVASISFSPKLRNPIEPFLVVSLTYSLRLERFSRLNG